MFRIALLTTYQIVAYVAIGTIVARFWYCLACYLILISLSDFGLCLEKKLKGFLKTLDAKEIIVVEKYDTICGV